MSFSDLIFKRTYAFTEDETWEQCSRRVSHFVAQAAPTELGKRELEHLFYKVISTKKFIPGGRYLYSAGRKIPQINNCFLFRADDSREGWGRLVDNHVNCLATGGGCGTEFTNVRASGTPIKGYGGTASGPISLMMMVNEVARHVLAGGKRRSALWAGLNWQHGDIEQFISIKNWSTQIRACKEADFNFPAPLDMTNISVGLDDEFFKQVTGGNRKAWDLYYRICKSMCKTGEPGFSVNVGDKSGETLRNACTEVTSEFDSDTCNLGSVNLSRIDDLHELRETTQIATLFLYCGTFLGWMPKQDFADVRDRIRRIGVGLMGVHEWCLKNDLPYGPSDKLARWLFEWKEATEAQAKDLARTFGPDAVKPIALRAIAPTGCQRPDTLVVTEDGLLELRELGDTEGQQWQSLNLEVSQEGIYQEATRFYVNGISATKKIQLSSGLELECTPHHKYRVLAGVETSYHARKRYGAGSYAWKQADALVPGDLLVASLGTYHKKTEPQLLPVIRHYRTEHVSFVPPEAVTRNLAWFLGVYYADGNLSRHGLNIACDVHKPEHWQKIKDMGTQLFGIAPSIEDNGRGCVSVRFNSSQLLRWLVINGLEKPESAQMYLPDVIRCFSRGSLESFIKGYQAGDGSQNKTGGWWIDTCAAPFSRQLVAILRALGHDAVISISSKEDSSGKYGTTKMYRIYVPKTKRKVTKKYLPILQALDLGHCAIDTVTSVCDSTSLTLDVEVPSGNTYLANGFVSHNTIGIIGETTTGIEPIYCVAYKRRFLNGSDGRWKYTYVIDPTAERLIRRGIKPDTIEDAYKLAHDFERRIQMQAFIQGYVDQSISSTINLPAWGEPGNNNAKHFAQTLLKYLPQLRGITAYPDASREGQPITPIDYAEAVKHKDVVFEESGDRCIGGTCGL